MLKCLGHFPAGGLLREIKAYRSLWLLTKRIRDQRYSRRVTTPDIVECRKRRQSRRRDRMATYSAGHPAFRAVQSFFRVMLGLHLADGPRINERVGTGPSPNLARLHRELAEVGDLLVDAIRLETEYEA